MTKKFIQLLALASFTTFCAVAPSVAQDTAEQPKNESPAKAQKKIPTVMFRFRGPENLRWETNYPKMLFPPERARLVRGQKGLANVKETRSGLMVEKTETANGASYELSKKLSDVVQIAWPEDDPLLEDASAELARGNPSGALEIAERFLKFFAPLKAVDGSPWIKGAVIKLDALDQQQNDAILDSFITEIEASPNADKVEGLSQKIKLARLNQLVRKGENTLVLSSCEKMMNETADVEMLARLHLLKGDAQYNLSRYEDALKTYLRIPVFYGNQSTFMPSAKLAVARCFLRMDKPELKAMNLAARSEEYLMEVIKSYPMSPEAKEALKMLPKHKRAALENFDAAEEAKKRAEVTSKIDAEQAERRAEDAEYEEASAAEEEAIKAEEEDDPDNV